MDSLYLNLFGIKIKLNQSSSIYFLLLVRIKSRLLLTMA